MSPGQGGGRRSLQARGEVPVGVGVPEQGRRMAEIEPQRMSPERDKWMFEHMTDMPLSANICPIPLGADSIRRAVDSLAVPFTMMTPMPEGAEALGCNGQRVGGVRDDVVNLGELEGGLKHVGSNT